jgi:hypothetical protein
MVPDFLTWCAHNTRYARTGERSSAHGSTNTGGHPGHETTYSRGTNPATPGRSGTPRHRHPFPHNRSRAADTFA